MVRKRLDFRVFLRLCMLLLAVIPILLYGYLTINFAHERLYHEKKAKIATVARAAVSTLSQTPKPELPPGLSREEQRSALNKTFQPVINNLVEDPDVAIGLFLKEVNAFVAWAPAEYSEAGLHVTDLKDGKEPYWLKSKGETLEYVFPIQREDNTAGYIVVRDPVTTSKSDLLILYYQQIGMIIVSLLFAVSLLSVLMRILSKNLSEVGETILTTMGETATASADDFKSIVKLINSAVDKRFAEKDLFSSILDNLPVGIIATDIEGRFSLINDKAQQILGYKQNELLGLTYRDLYLLCQPQPLDNAASPYPIFREGKPFSGYQMNVLRKDHSKVTVEVSVYPLHSVEGQRAGSLSILRDLSLEMDYGALQNWTQATVDCLQTGVIAIDNDLQVRIFNPAAEKLFEQPAAEMLGSDISKSPMTGRILSETLQKGQGVINQQTSIEVKGRKKELLVNSTMVKDKLGEVVGVVAVFLDVTELRYYEQTVKEQEKLAVIGQMAAGMAHELRNPLTTVRGFIQLAKEKILGDEKTRNYFELIMQEIDRTNKIINDFLILAKPKPPSLELCSPNELVINLAPLLESQCALFGDFNLLIDLCEALPPVMMDEDQIKQVMLNLAQNGIQSMLVKGSGELTVSTRHVKEERMVVLSVADSGEGITAENLAKIGTPFFTTKETGTGLGLSVSYRIVDAHGGKIKVHSEKGKGSIFEIWLPEGYL